jgi:hypothetical protein
MPLFEIQTADPAKRSPFGPRHCPSLGGSGHQNRSWWRVGPAFKWPTFCGEHERAPTGVLDEGKKRSVLRD